MLSANLDAYVLGFFLFTPLLYFQVRLANNPYSLDKHSFFEYETHFTVMVCLSFMTVFNLRAVKHVQRPSVSVEL